MNRIVRLGLGAAVFVAAGLAAVVVWPIGRVVQLIDLVGDVGNGAYLARAGGCIACHSDAASGGAPLAGGVKIATPFGAIYSPNLTADSEHGIGDWTIEQFSVAVRQGISPTGEAYFPAFPYAFYSNFTNQDIADLWSAFQTVPAVAQASKANELAAPFNQRWGLKLWRAAFLASPPTGPVTDETEAWNRGRLLVEGATHCAACHTERNLLGARKAGDYHLKGNDALADGDKAPPIDAASLHEQGWTAGALAYALESGILPDGDSFGGGMGEVVQGGTSFLTQDDREAIATYLLNLQTGG